jgi:TolB-like protein
MAPTLGVTDPAQEPPESPGRLDSWKEIAVYLGRSVRTVRRWEESEGLPVHRHLHEKSGSVYAFKPELDAWLLGRRTEPESAARAEDAVGPPDAVPPSVPGATVSDKMPSAAQSTPNLLRGRAPLLLVVTGLLVIGAIASMAQRPFGRWTGSGTAPVAIRSIAVLPVDNLTGDPAREYFVDSMTDALIDELAQIDNLLVKSRTSSMQFKGVKRQVPDIARELEVDAVIEGSAILSDGQVHLRTRLIHAPSDVSLWSQNYKANDVIALPTEIARAIAAVIGNNGAPPSSPPLGPRAVSPEAGDLYLRGRYQEGRASVGGSRAAISYYEQAIAKQPDFARAYASLANAQEMFLYNGPWSPDEVLPKMEKAALKALALDDTLRDARTALATVRRTYGDHAGASAEMAVLRGQRWPVGTNRPPTAVARVARAELGRERDPHSVFATLGVALAYRAAGNHDRAIAEYKRAVQMEPTLPNTWFQLGVTFARQRNLKEAIPAVERAVDLSTERNPRYLAYLGHLHAMDGRPDEARRILRELLARREQQYVSSFGIALLHDALGEKAAAMSALERAAKEHAIEFTQLGSYPPFKTLASESRYKELMRITSR